VTTLSRAELTSATAVRQLLSARARLDPVAAIRRLSPLQAQDPPAPYVALAARLEGFDPAALEAAITAGQVVKATVMRGTLHLLPADEHVAFHVVARAVRRRALQAADPAFASTVAGLAEILDRPRTRDELRAHLGIPKGSGALAFTHASLPVHQLPPAGHRTDDRRPLLALDPRPEPAHDEAAALVLRRYLGAFGPASLADAARWAGCAQADLREAWERLGLEVLHDEDGRELRDLPGAPRPPGDLPLPVRFLARWDQPLLAYADRERILPAEVPGPRITHRGVQCVLVDGRVAASWRLERGAKVTRVDLEILTAVPRRARRELREEAVRTARAVVPTVSRVELAGLR
jgi:hypothetical protein